MLNLERPDFSYFFRSGGAQSCRVADRELEHSFIVSPTQLIEGWNPSLPLSVADLEPLLALNPEVIILGTGATQVFPPAAVMAYCLSRRIGLDVMNNASAARTFNVLAGEARQVVAGIILSP